MGETKSAKAWSADERSPVAPATILDRLRRGFDTEDAISRPHIQKSAITAWGITRSYREWAKSPLAVVDYHTLQRRIQSGWEPERAITEEKHFNGRDRTWNESPEVELEQAAARYGMALNTSDGQQIHGALNAVRARMAQDAAKVAARDAVDARRRQALRDELARLRGEVQ